MTTLGHPSDQQRTADIKKEIAVVTSTVAWREVLETDVGKFAIVAARKELVDSEDGMDMATH